jgi:hypothetical protein
LEQHRFRNDKVGSEREFGERADSDAIISNGGQATILLKESEVEIGRKLRESLRERKKEKVDDTWETNGK